LLRFGETSRTKWHVASITACLIPPLEIRNKMIKVIYKSQTHTHTHHCCQSCSNPLEKLQCSEPEPEGWILALCTASTLDSWDWRYLKNVFCLYRNNQRKIVSLKM
uniref:Uncharacterized protein n=1 Tax=Varanus komodoensis TaxID=61221 RepID=A0A8D2J5Q4_VARKO